MSRGFYLQDARQYVGNDLLFWAKDSKGYTTDVSKAHVFTELEALEAHEWRGTDVPWPKEYIDSHTRPAVDTQHVDHEIAMSHFNTEAGS